MLRKSNLASISDCHLIVISKGVP